jgi:glycosyltransferase involved in cell wall biosynthesis
MAAVNAFKQAFPQTDKTVGLVLKTMNTNPENLEWQEFLNECKSDQRIQVLTETMDRPDVLGLIDCCDAYVSLHRAEGFGRTIAEAILLNKKVISTNYSGNVDFNNAGRVFEVSYSLIRVANEKYQWIVEEDSAEWSDPSIADASIKMMNCKKEIKTLGMNSDFTKNKFLTQYTSKLINTILTKY